MTDKVVKFSTWIFSLHLYSWEGFFLLGNWLSTALNLNKTQLKKTKQSKFATKEKNLKRTIKKRTIKKKKQQTIKNELLKNELLNETPSLKKQLKGEQTAVNH